MIVAFGIGRQLHGFARVVDHPHIGIEPVVFPIPGRDDKSDAAAVIRNLRIAGAVECDDIFRRHRPFDLRKRQRQSRYQLKQNRQQTKAFSH